MKAEGFTVGKSLVEASMLETAREIKKRAEEKGIQFLLPTDHQVVDSYEPVKGDKIVAKTIPIEVYKHRACGNGYRCRECCDLLSGASGRAHDHLEWSNGCV